MFSRWDWSILTYRLLFWEAPYVFPFGRKSITFPGCAAVPLISYLFSRPANTKCGSLAWHTLLYFKNFRKPAPALFFAPLLHLIFFTFKSKREEVEKPLKHYSYSRTLQMCFHLKLIIKPTLVFVESKWHL